MAFYDLSKEQRVLLAEQINSEILEGIQQQQVNRIVTYCSDEDTYIRKTAYLAVGRIYKKNPELQPAILKVLEMLFQSEEEKIRQTVVNAAGEIGMRTFEVVESFFDKGLFDPHHSVRNAVIGSLKKMSEKNPQPVLRWAKNYLHHEDKEIRREICHGIELRGRTHPQEILPLLKELQFDPTARVKKTLIHVLGQIAYKKGCLETVMENLIFWENKELVLLAIDEIVDVHERYKKFSVLTQEQAIAYIQQILDREQIIKIQG